MDGIGDTAQPGDESIVVQAELKRRVLPARLDRDVAADDQPGAAANEVRTELNGRSVASPATVAIVSPVAARTRRLRSMSGPMRPGSR
jgi:hypothetical protein